MSRQPRLVLIEPTGASREVTITATPFRIGRQTGNELTLRDSRISRLQAQIQIENGRYILEDMGSRHGTFVNGQKVEKHELQAKDQIDFGVGDSFRLVYLGDTTGISDLEELIGRVEAEPTTPATSRELHHLGVLLEVARVLHAGLALEDVLAAVLDAAIGVTHTQRGVLLLAQSGGQMKSTVARDAQRRTLRPEDLDISMSVLKQVVKTRRELIVTDMDDDPGISAQASVVRLQLHTVVAIPIEKLPVMNSLDTTAIGAAPELVGVLYLDSHAPSSAFSDLDREVLRSLATEAATVIENARLFADSRAKERLEHEMKIAKEIQQTLLPKRFPGMKHFSVTGINIACESIGGDYFDVIELTEDRTGLVVADVSGKGISAALLASMLQGVFSATAGMDIPLETVASRVNKYLCDRSADDRYATLFYGVLEPSGRMDYVNAGHVPAMVRTSLGQVYPLASDNAPVGMFDFAEYRSNRAFLQPGDFVVIYTDGISEARNTADDMFGEHGLREALKKFSGSTVEELSLAVRAAVGEFTAGAPQADDLTLLVILYHGSATAPGQDTDSGSPRGQDG
ncbi:MAG TPA: SpoIIE family protein phosphatase [Candidatus Acidoferrales bacterium]